MGFLPNDYTTPQEIYEHCTDIYDIIAASGTRLQKESQVLPPQRLPLLT